MLPRLHPARDRAPHELARDADRIGDPVLAADRRARARRRRAAPATRRRRPPRPARRARAARSRRCSSSAAPARRRREEEVADLLEERRAELLEEAARSPGEPHLGLGRELLPHAAHRAAGRSARDLARVGEDDAVRPGERQVVGDRGADRARAGYDDSCHVAQLLALVVRQPRAAARRTSSRIGTPRRPSTNLNAACRG